MTDEHQNILTLNSFFLLIHEKTKHAYLDNSFNCYLFQTKSAADSFKENLKLPVCINEPKTITIKDVCELFNQGAKGIRVFLRNQKAPLDIELELEYIKKKNHQYYNHDTNANLNRLQQTAERPYLTELTKGVFFTPVKIEPREEGEYPSIHYSYAIFKDPTQYYLLFSTLEEYEKWKLEQSIEWRPMEISINKFQRIRGKNPVLINPLSNKLILNHKILKKAVSPIHNETVTFGGK